MPMFFHAEQRSIALAALFLSLGLAINVYANTEVTKTKEEIKEITLSPVPPATGNPAPIPDARMITPVSEVPLESGYHQPPVSKQEVGMFVQEMKNVTGEAARVLKDLKTAAASKSVDEWRAALNEVAAKASDCIARAKTGTDDENRDTMNECRSANLFNDVNDIRQQFVPPQEIKNVLNDIKNQEKELSRFAKQIKTAGGLSDMVKKLQSEIARYRSNITSAVGQDQRDAMQEWWDARFWEEVNKVRGLVEIPKQLKGASKDLSGIEKALMKETFKKAAAFFGADHASITSAVAQKRSDITAIEGALAQGDGEAAQETMQESIHNGWHPGDLRGIVDMLSGAYSQMKRVKDVDLREQLTAVFDPIVESINAGEYRDAQGALHQVDQEIRKYERYFQGSRTSTYGKKMNQAFGNLESLMKKKFEKYYQEDQASFPEEEERE